MLVDESSDEECEDNNSQDGSNIAATSENAARGQSPSNCSKIVLIL